MGLFPSLYRSFSNIADPQQWLIDAFGGSGKTVAGTTIDQHSSLGISVVYSCVTCISEAIASLPMIVYKERKSGGRDRVRNHPLYDLLKNKPNPEMTSFSMREAQTAHILLWGNKFSFIERDVLNRVKSIYPLTPHRVSVERNDDYKIIYHVIDRDGHEKEYGADQILHTPGFSYNGLFGQSVISIQREKLGIAAALDEFEGRFFGQGTHPSAVVKLPPEARMDEETQKKYMAKMKSDYSGLGKSHGLMILPNGEELTPMTMPLHDAQFLELYKAKGADICGWFKVPPHMVAILDHATFSNIEHQAIQFAVHCIRPWLVREEQAINVKLLTDQERRDGYYVENTIDGLLRGDVKARSEFYQAMFNIGAMSPNDIREKENMNPYDGGKNRFVPLNMIPTDMAGEVAKFGKEPPPKAKDPKKEKKTLRLSESEKRSIIVRDRISDQYRPLIHRAAEGIVSYESKAIKNQLEKRSMESWLDGFYRDIPDYIKDKIGPVFRSFAIAIRDAAAEEIGIEPDEIDIEKFISDYIETYAKRHSSSSLNQLLLLVEDEIEGRVLEWEEKRADKIADNEVNRASNAVFQFAAFGAGLSTVWRIRGAHTCPYCKTLSGKRIRSGQVFAKKGEEIAPEGEQPMKNRGIKRHPPLHRGCDCYIGII